MIKKVRTTTKKQYSTESQTIWYIFNIIPIWKFIEVTPNNPF